MAKVVDPLRLQQAAPHVGHDIRLFRMAWEAHNSNPFAWTAWFVHCRSLMDFFDCQTSDPDDIHASDYLPAWATLRAPLAQPLTYKTVRIQVNKLAAHLTYTRVDLASLPSPPRPSQEITDYLLGQAVLFLRHLPDDTVTWFGHV